jgi:hypothetical protein
MGRPSASQRSTVLIGDKSGDRSRKAQPVRVWSLRASTMARRRWSLGTQTPASFSTGSRMAPPLSVRAMGSPIRSGTDTVHLLHVTEKWGRDHPLGGADQTPLPRSLYEVDRGAPDPPPAHRRRCPKSASRSASDGRAQTSHFGRNSHPSRSAGTQASQAPGSR